MYSITMGSQVTTIQDSAFEECSALEAMTFPNTVVNLGQNVFRMNSALTDFDFGTGLSSVPDNTFTECSMLARITIEGQAFDCSSFATSITQRSKFPHITFKSTATAIDNAPGVDCDGTKCGCDPGYENTLSGGSDPNSVLVQCSPCSAGLYQDQKYYTKFCNDCDPGMGTCGEGSNSCQTLPLPCHPTMAPTASYLLAAQPGHPRQTPRMCRPRPPPCCRPCHQRLTRPSRQH